MRPGHKCPPHRGEIRKEPPIISGQRAPGSPQPDPDHLRQVRQRSGSCHQPQLLQHAPPSPSPSRHSKAISSANYVQVTARHGTPHQQSLYIKRHSSVLPSPLLLCHHDYSPSFQPIRLSFNLTDPNHLNRLEHKIVPLRNSNHGAADWHLVRSPDRDT